MKILIVGMQHGNEIFGKTVLDYYADTDIDTLIANPVAYEKNVRFIDTDLNRSYRKSPAKGYEEKRANEVYKIAKKYDFVIDIHTTSTDIDIAPLIASQNSKVLMALSYIPCINVASMEFAGVENSLIGSLPNSISLEFNENYAEQSAALKIVQKVVDGLNTGHPGQHRHKKIYSIIGTIPQETKITENEKNFKLSTRLGYYPFLMGEKNYQGYKGFYAEKFKSIDI